MIPIPPHAPLDRSSVQKYREASDINDITHQMELIDIYRMFHSNSKENTFCTIAHSSFSKINISEDTKQILKENLNNLRKI